MLDMFNKAFTIVEVMVAITITSILIGLLFKPLDDLYQSNDRSLRSVVQATDIRSTLDTIDKQVSLSQSFLGSNGVTDPTGASWSSTAGNVLITRNYATSLDPANDPTDTRTLAFSDATCSTPLYNNYVYFVSSGTLYRRTLKNTATPGCGTNGQIPTCPSGCAAKDAKLLSNVTLFSIRYYTAATPTTTTSDPLTAKSVVVTIETTSRDLKTTNSLRISKAN